MDWLSYSLSAQTFVHVGIGLYVLGFLLRHQVALRCAVLAGEAMYLAYYATLPGGPLWDPMIGSAMILSANLIGIAALALSRFRFSMPQERRALMDAMGDVEPGVFRALMRIADERVADDRVVLTREGETPDALYFTLSGTLTISKAAGSFDVPARCFIGEVSWMLGVPASATVTAAVGTRYVSLPRARLARLTERNQRVRLGLDALLAQDMARKVSASLQAAAKPTMQMI